MGGTFLKREVAFFRPISGKGFFNIAGNGTGFTGWETSELLVGGVGMVFPSSSLSYGGQPAGFAGTPLEDVNYCSVHDNQTLFDAIQIKVAAADTVALRARRQVLSMSLLALAEGIPFFHAGDDLLRSKDMDNGSYNSGDWFNKIDWTGRGDNWGTGLPIAGVNQTQWPIEQPLLASGSLKPTSSNIQLTTQVFKDFLKIRYSTGLFRMATLAEIQQKLIILNTGQNQTAGLIIMRPDDHGHNYGGAHHLVVHFNAANTQPPTPTRRSKSSSCTSIPCCLPPPTRLSGNPPLIRRPEPRPFRR